MIIQPSETGLTMIIHAERPETLDMVRRHADTLSAALEEAGYDKINLSFGRDTGGFERGSDRPGNARADDSGADAHKDAVDDAHPMAGAPGRAIVATDGLDIRI